MTTALTLYRMMLTPLAVLGLALTGACLDEHSPKREPQPLNGAEVGATAAANVRALSGEWTAASAWMEDSDLSSWLGGVAAAGGGDGTDPGLDDNASDTSFADVVNELATKLEQELLVESNIESNDGTTIVYRVPAEWLCGVEGTPEAGTAEADCVARLTAIPVRVRVVSFAAGDLELTLIVGDDGLEPLVIELGRQKVALTADVADAFEAARLFGAQGDGAADDVVVRSVAGQLRVTFEQRSDHHAVVSAEVVQPLAIDADLGGYPLNVSAGRSKLSLDLDGDAKKLTLDSDAGALEASVPFQLIADLLAGEDCTASIADPEPVCTPAEAAQVDGTLHIDLAGASARLVLDEQRGSLKLEHLGLGARRSTVMLDDALVVGVDLNPSAGRSFDLTLTRDAAGESMTIAVSPKVDLDLELGLAHLAALDADLAGSWAGEERLGVLLEGTLRMLDHGLEVVSGSLRLTSASRPDLDIEVSSGQCLLGEDTSQSGGAWDPNAPIPPEEPAPSHPFENLSAGACPN